LSYLQMTWKKNYLPCWESAMRLAKTVRPIIRVTFIISLNLNTSFRIMICKFFTLFKLHRTLLSFVYFQYQHFIRIQYCQMVWKFPKFSPNFTEKLLFLALRIQAYTYVIIAMLLMLEARRAYLTYQKL